MVFPSAAALEAQSGSPWIPLHSSEHYRMEFDLDYSKASAE